MRISRARWITEPLGEVVDFVGGGTPSRTVPDYWGGSIPWATVKDFKSTRIARTLESITPDGLNNSASRIIPKGTLVMPTRMALGKVAVTEVDIAINQDLKALLPRRRMDTRYLLHALLARAPQIEARGNGATVKGITIGDLGDIEVGFPDDEDEQKRIAAILDKADAIRVKRREVLLEANALLRVAFLDLFGDPVGNPKGWDTLPIAEIIADGPQNGLYRHSSEYGSGTPILRIDSFYNGRTKDLSSLKRVRIDEETLARWALHADDIVINRVNSLEYLGKSAIIPPLSEPTVFESNMMRFAVDRAIIEPGFLIDQLQTDHVRRQIRKRARPAVNQSSINQDDVKSIEVRIPPIDLQKAYVAAAKRIERFREVAQVALADADTLYASLAQRAFSGEL